MEALKDVTASTNKMKQKKSTKGKISKKRSDYVAKMLHKEYIQRR